MYPNLITHLPGTPNPLEDFDGVQVETFATFKQPEVHNLGYVLSGVPVKTWYFHNLSSAPFIPILLDCVGRIHIF